MQRFKQLTVETKLELFVGALSSFCFVSGYLTNNMYVCGAAGTCVILLVIRWMLRQRSVVSAVQAVQAAQAAQAGQAGQTKTRTLKKRRPQVTDNPKTAAALMERMLEQGRSAILLRPEVIKNVNREQRQAAAESLDRDMARVSAGKVWLYAPTKLEIENGATPGPPSETSEILIDRCTVTNHEYQMFVDDRGYDNDEFWCELSADVKPQFVDTTEEAGPRFWVNGAFPNGEGHLPVVGVSWYEACAYARWAGKRLPTGPEWVKAAVAPTSTVSVASQQRKFPSGESVETWQANLWQSGIGKTVSVTDFADVSAHDIYQMIGNVWEWNQDDFATWQSEAGWDFEGSSLKSIRGGAFDTYLDSQAACRSQSGEEAFARRHNVGFRCVADPGQLVSQD